MAKQCTYLKLHTEITKNKETKTDPILPETKQYVYQRNKKGHTKTSTSSNKTEKCHFSYSNTEWLLWQQQN